MSERSATTTYEAPDAAAKASQAAWMIGVILFAVVSLVIFVIVVNALP